VTDSAESTVVECTLLRYRLVDSGIRDTPFFKIRIYTVTRSMYVRTKTCAGCRYDLIGLRWPRMHSDLPVYLLCVVVGSIITKPASYELVRVEKSQKKVDSQFMEE